MRSSYLESDVTLLLKDITGQVTPLPASEREKRIQSGTHYCEMLPLEYQPSQPYLEAYYAALAAYAKPTAEAVCQVAEKIVQLKGEQVVLVSMARAGIPVGILIKHYLEKKYHIPVPHYAISIIRGRGIDHNAIQTILHNHSPQSLQLVDGWIGKGAIQNELYQALQAYPEISPELAVLSDPAQITDLCGTHEDLLIPSSCLNSTVSGLISRTFLRDDIIGKTDYHGAAYYENLQEQDLSYAFIEAIERHFDLTTEPHNLVKGTTTGLSEVQSIARCFCIADINLIKPGIGEATRVLLRRVPWKLLIQPGLQDDPMLRHILRLAAEKQVPIEYYPMQNYKACGLIKQIADA